MNIFSVTVFGWFRRGAIVNSVTGNAQVNTPGRHRLRPYRRRKLDIFQGCDLWCILVRGGFLVGIHIEMCSGHPDIVRKHIKPCPEHSDMVRKGIYRKVPVLYLYQYPIFRRYNPCDENLVYYFGHLKDTTHTCSRVCVRVSKRIESMRLSEKNQRTARCSYGCHHPRIDGQEAAGCSMPLPTVRRVKDSESWSPSILRGKRCVVYSSVCGVCCIRALARWCFRVYVCFVLTIPIRPLPRQMSSAPSRRGWVVNG